MFEEFEEFEDAQEFSTSSGESDAVELDGAISRVFEPLFMLRTGVVVGIDNRVSFLRPSLSNPLD